MLLTQESSFRLPQVGVAFKNMVASQVVTVGELQVLEINSYISRRRNTTGEARANKC